MTIHFPIYTYFGIDGYQMFPGTAYAPGIHHELSPGLHLIAGVNGLGKTTLLLLLYHGVIGPAAIKNDDFSVASPEIASRRDADKFRRRVADNAKDAISKINFAVGSDRYEICRSLYDLSIVNWKVNDIEQTISEEAYMDYIARSMNVSTFADVIVIMNLIVFMFESREFLIWNSLAQRNVLRSLFMTPDDAKTLAESAKAVATANSSYRNFLYILNKERKNLKKNIMALNYANELNKEFETLKQTSLANNENIKQLMAKRSMLEDNRIEARASNETAKLNFDEILREIEATKITLIAHAFPKSDESSQYVLARLIGDHECLACGAIGGSLIEKWSSAVAERHCVLCGAHSDDQEVVVPPEAVDTVRLKQTEERLVKARQAMETTSDNVKISNEKFEQIQREIDEVFIRKSEIERRISQIKGVLPPTPFEVKKLEHRVQEMEETLQELINHQEIAEYKFSMVFKPFRTLIERKADAIRNSFAKKISEFLVEKAEISLSYIQSPVGESGRSYQWPTFKLSMTSGTFGAPAPRRQSSEVSMSQGEFIDLAFRLALVEVAAESSPASMVFDSPEASLDALFMRRAGAFLARFTSDNSDNRLIVTSNLTNTDMIPALFGAYDPQIGDPKPQMVPRSERHSRVIDLLSLASPSSAVQLLGDRYEKLLDRALFPPAGYSESGL